MAQDDSFARLLASWSDESGLSAKASAAASQLNLAMRLLDGAKRAGGGSGVEPESNQEVRIQACFAAFHVANAEFEECLESTLKSGWMAIEIGAYLMAHGLTWEWLSNLLIDACLGSVNACLAGTEQVAASLGPDAAMAVGVQPLDQAFIGRRGVQVAIAGIEERLAGAAETGLLARKKREMYEKYGRWLYQSAIGEQPKRLIARIDLGSVNQTSQIRYGLRRAREELAVGDLITEHDL
jgi:hypothetical protein